MSSSNFSATNLVCNGLNQTHIYILSKVCMNRDTFEKDLCVPGLDQRRPCRIAVGVWALIVMTFGVFGNIFTLLAIPYAAKKQR